LHWRFETEKFISFSPAVADHRIFVSIDNISPEEGAPPQWVLSIRPGGMRFEARAHITSGLLSPEQIRLHFIQNVTKFEGRLQVRAPRASPSDPIVEKRLDLQPLRSDCGSPLLDMYRDEAPPPPFYHEEVLTMFSAPDAMYGISAVDHPWIQNIGVWLLASLSFLGASFLLLISLMTPLDSLTAQGRVYHLSGIMALADENYRPSPGAGVVRFAHGMPCPHISRSATPTRLRSGASLFP
jgi:hypothetical protein